MEHDLSFISNLGIAFIVFVCIVACAVGIDSYKSCRRNRERNQRDD